MGTPEFPDLGKHCSVEDCKQIDFLPFTCDRCYQIYCLEHRSYIKHHCPKADKKDVTVVICPLCAKGVRLVHDEDPNISWEKHVNMDCDPSNYDRVTKKKKCPVPGCREVLTFSNTIKCRDCSIDHCLKHRFGPDHKCHGPMKSDSSFPFMGLLSRSRKEESKPNRAVATSSSNSSSWTTSFLNAASTSMTKLSSELSQKWQIAKDGMGLSGDSSSSSSNGNTGQAAAEVCPQCGAKFASVTKLVEHVEKVHERKHQSRVFEMSIDVCPRCNQGFRDPVALVQHVERDHGGTTKA